MLMSLKPPLFVGGLPDLFGCSVEHTLWPECGIGFCGQRAGADGCGCCSLDGDEDNGQTSAWFVFSSLGFYPVAPVTGQYVIGSPLFEEVTIELSNGKELKINAKNNSISNVYIKNFQFNQSKSNNNWIGHNSLKAGGVIDFEMSDTPNLNWGADKNSVPYSMSKDE